jgi:hypothetical protein
MVYDERLVEIKGRIEGEVKAIGLFEFVPRKSRITVQSE